MAEQQVTGFPTKAAPNSRTTKDSERFELLAVNATFDGSAASADFLPAVEIVSDSGVVVARHVTGSTVTAGDSAEVTFAPFLGRASGAGASATEIGSYLSDAQVVSDPGEQLAFVYDNGDALLNVAVPDVPRFVAAGTYIVTVTMFQTFDIQYPGTLFFLNLIYNGDTGTPGYQAYQSVSPTKGGSTPQASVTLPHVATANEKVQAQIGQNSGVDIAFTSKLTVCKIGS